MIGQKQSQGYCLVALFSVSDCTGSQTVKAAVVSHHKIGDAALCDMLFYRLDQCGATDSPVSRCPMKKQVLMALSHLSCPVKMCPTV